MNKDLDERYIEDGDYSHAENIRVSSPAEGDVGVVKNIPSTIEAMVLESYPSAKILSFATDKINDVIYIFLKATLNAGGTQNMIISHDRNKVYTEINEFGVVPNYDIVLKGDYLNFGDTPFSDGIVLEDYLVWTDNINPPRKYNLTPTLGNIGLYLFDEEDDVSIIRKPPIKEPEVEAVFDTSVHTNNLDDSILVFSYRYVYDNNEKSSLSFFSKPLYNQETEGRADELRSFLLLDNNKITSINVTMETGGYEVKEIELYVKDINSNTFYQAKIINKLNDGVSNDSQITENIRVYKKGSVLSDQEAIKLFDNVPLKAAGVESIDNRICFYDYTEGYDVDISPDISITTENVVVEAKTSRYARSSLQSLPNNASYSIDVSYSKILFIGDQVFPAKEGETFVFKIDYTGTKTVRNPYDTSTIVSNVSFNIEIIDTLNADYATLEAYFIANPNIIDQIRTAQNNTSLTLITFSYSGNKLTVTFPNYYNDYSIQYDKYIVTSFIKPIQEERLFTYRHTDEINFGIIYYDDYNRSSSIVSSKFSNITLPHPIGNYTSTTISKIIMNIRHKAPEWATKFKIARTGYENNHDNESGRLVVSNEVGSVENPFNSIKGVRILKKNKGTDISEDSINKFKIGSYIELFGHISTIDDSVNIFDSLVVLEIVSVDSAELAVEGSTSLTEYFVKTKTKKGDLANLLDKLSGEDISTDTKERMYPDLFFEVVSTRLPKQNYYEIGKTFYLDEFGNHIGGDIDQTDNNDFSVEIEDDDGAIDSLMRHHYKYKDRFLGNKYDSIDSLRVNNISNLAKQTRRKSSITYSGKYVKENSLNELNSFNLATGNYEDFDKSKGAIMKLHPREGDMYVFQEDGISRILVAKDALYGGDGKATISVIEGVLGQKIYLPYNNGISKNGESLAYDGSIVFFTDAKRGVVCALDNDGIIEISDTGMSGEFKRLFDSGTLNYARGAYDKMNEEYIIQISTDDTLRTFGFNKRVKGWVSEYLYSPSMFIGMSDRLYSSMDTYESFKLYKHDADYSQRGNLHGIEVVSKVVTQFNQEPETAKIARSVSLDSSHALKVTLTADEKVSTINPINFKDKEGDWVAFVGRNENNDKSAKNYKGMSKYVSTLGNTITVTLPINTIDISVGDTLCYFRGGIITEIGNITSLSGNTVTVNAIASAPANLDFILAKKPNYIEGAMIRGGVIKAEIELPQNTGKVELSTIKLEVNKSFS